MLVCHECHSHVRLDDPTCPFCGASIRTTAAGRGSKLGTTALSAGLAMLGCATEPAPTDAGGDSTTQISGSSSDSSTDSSSDTTTESTDTGDTTTESSTDWAEEAAYGVPEIPCDELAPEPVALGDNAIAVTTDYSEVYQSCGGVGTASLYAFTAEADGTYEFALIDADFSPVVSLVGFLCAYPTEEIACALPPETVSIALLADETVHIAVDSADAQVDGLATLQIVQP